MVIASSIFGSSKIEMAGHNLFDLPKKIKMSGHNFFLFRALFESAECFMESIKF